MRLCAAVAVLALLAAAPAYAGERLIAPSPVDGLQAGGGWLSWIASDSQMMWHGGEPMDPHAPFVRPLGTDRQGRAVGLVVGCGSERCVVRHLLLPHGAISQRLATAGNLRAVDENRGSLLVGFRGRGHPKGIYLRPGGEHALRRISKVLPGALSISSNAMTNLDPDERLYAADRDRPHRWSLLATGSDPDFVRGQAGPFRFVNDSQAEGRYAYWLETSYETDENGVESHSATRILRVNPGLSHRHLEVFAPPRSVYSLAVTGGRLYYTDRATGDLYEFRHPSFTNSGNSIPVGR